MPSKRQVDQQPPPDPVHWMLHPVARNIRARMTAAAKVKNVTTPVLVSEICAEWLKRNRFDDM